MREYRDNQRGTARIIADDAPGRVHTVGEHIVERGITGVRWRHQRRQRGQDEINPHADENQDKSGEFERIVGNAQIVSRHPARAENESNANENKDRNWVGGQAKQIERVAAGENQNEDKDPKRKDGERGRNVKGFLFHDHHKLSDAQYWRTHTPTRV